MKYSALSGLFCTLAFALTTAADNCYEPSFVEKCCQQHHFGCQDLNGFRWTCPPLFVSLDENVYERVATEDGWQYETITLAQARCVGNMPIGCGNGTFGECTWAVTATTGFCPSYPDPEVEKDCG